MVCYDGRVYYHYHAPQSLMTMSLQTNYSTSFKLGHYRLPSTHSALMHIRNPFKSKNERDDEVSVTPPAVPSFNSNPLAAIQAVATSEFQTSTHLKRGQGSRDDGKIDEQDVSDRHGKKPRESEVQPSAVSKSLDRSLMPPPPPPGAPGSHLRSNMSSMALQAPAPTYVFVRTNSGHVGASESQVSLNSQASRRSGLRSSTKAMLTSKNFVPGTIITAPHHCTALKPDADPNVDFNFCQSSIATICSKRRMMVVLWSYQQSVLTLPLETHTRRGLESIPNRYKGEYICLKDQGDRDWWNGGIHDPLVVAWLRGRSGSGPESIGKLSSLRLSNVVTIAHREEVEIVGHLTTHSTTYLQRIWFDMAEKAIKNGWEDERVEQVRLGRSNSRNSMTSKPPSRPAAWMASKPPSRPTSWTGPELISRTSSRASSEPLSRPLSKSSSKTSSRWY